MFSKVTSLFDNFKKPADPKDLVRKWQSELRSEQRGMERQIRDLAREEKLAQKNVSLIVWNSFFFRQQCCFRPCGEGKRKNSTSCSLSHTQKNKN